ncbi:hypothetical protein DHC50_06260 [Arenibacter sp. A80]|nr:hypothetical protein [Arenibacter sp. A80]RFT57221.1 hypothetical protein D0S24_06260 [Arenibacter sp. P308M17]
MAVYSWHKNDFIVYCLSLTAYFADRCLIEALLAIAYSVLPIAHCSLFIVHCSLFIVHCSLQV